MIGETRAVVCTHLVRDRAGALASVLREHGVSADVAPSDRHVGEWDVLVPAYDDERANQIVRDLLTFG